MNEMQHYDAVIVLGMNITPVQGGFAPTTYKDHDEYGFLAGEMNVIAAVHLYTQDITNTLVFSTGTSKKTKAAYGENAPTEASVYSADFLKRLQAYRDSHPEAANLADPIIILEDRSVNTYSNLTECLEIIISQGWKRVAIMSARYHIPRAQMLFDMATKNLNLHAQVDFIMAEDIVVAAEPGKYDDYIAEAYASEWGQKRLAIEAQGKRDMEAGRYVVAEFQLAGGVQR